MEFRLKGKAIMEMGPEPLNMAQVHERSGVSYKTVHRYISGKPIQAIELEKLCAILSGAGLTRDQIINLRVGDLIEVID